MSSSEIGPRTPIHDMFNPGNVNSESGFEVIR